MFLFPKWTNRVTSYLLLGSIVSLLFVVFVFWFWFSPKNLDAGYAPKQPIQYSHALHVSQLGIDCRYCHENVEKAAHASLPSTETCMNCHSVVKKGKREGSEAEIAILIGYYERGESIPWVQVSFVPDYAYFDHSIHLNAGVSCVVCHGRIDQMEVVHQSKPLSMGWCLECHKAPEKHLRPHAFLTVMDWQTEDPILLGKAIRKEKNLQPKKDCSTCHR